MKLSFSTLGCPDWTFPEILQRAKEYGFDGVEVRGIGPELDSAKLTPFLSENARGTRQTLASMGLSIPCLGLSATLHDAGGAKAARKEAEQALAVARRMGIPFMRVFGDQLDPAHPEQSLGRIAAGLRDICDMAAPEIGVLLEIHGTCNTAEALAWLIEQVEQPNFGLLWDVQHSDRATGDDFLPYYRVIAAHVRHVHLKDGIRENGGHRPALVGQGDLPIREIVGQLLSDGYDGFFSIEWEKRWHPELAPPEEVFPAFVNYMRSLRP